VHFRKGTDCTSKLRQATPQGPFRTAFATNLPLLLVVRLSSCRRHLAGGNVPASVVQLGSHYGCSSWLAATVPAVRPIPRVGELPPPEGGDPPQAGSVLAFATCRTSNVDLLLSAPAARAISKARLDSGDWTEVLAVVPFEQSVDVTAADWRHCNARGGRADRSAQDPNSTSAAEGLAAKRAKAVGAVSQATGQLHGPGRVWMRWKRWSQTCRVAPQCSQESLSKSSTGRRKSVSLGQAGRLAISPC
jgi:hypothetical protein